MGSDGKTIAELVDELPLMDRTGSKVVALIRLCLQNSPEKIEQLAPGKRLVRRRLTAAERTRLASAAAAEKARVAAGERHERIVPIIEKVLKDNPDASLAEIKEVLDKSDVTPVRSAKWSRATINYIIIKAGIRAKDQS